MMLLGIDAVNIRSGGGVKHLNQLLRSFEELYGDNLRVILWCNKDLKRLVSLSKNIQIINKKWMDSFYILRLSYHLMFFGKSINNAKCEILLFPTGVTPYFTKGKLVTISQNMLPIEIKQASLFGLKSVIFWKLLLNRFLLLRSFRQSSAVIFLGEYAKDEIEKLTTIKKSIVIPHGIENELKENGLLKINDANESLIEKPFRLIYVSSIMPYKHQLEVLESIKILSDEGISIQCEFIGELIGKYGVKFKDELEKLNSQGKVCATYLSQMPYDDLIEKYKAFDALIFASSCENFPNILLEGMASGLPVALLNKRPMIDILGDSGFYFEDLLPITIARCIKNMMQNKNLMCNKARAGYEKSLNYSWEKCGRKTVEFIFEV